VTNYVVTGLSGGTSYDFAIIATNAAGSGPTSAVTTANTTPALTVPGTVTSLAVGTATTSALPLSWSAPTNGGAVATYTVQYRTHGSAAWTTATSTLTTTAMTLSGLAAGTSYDIQVFGVNGAGAGNAASVTASTLATVTYTVKPGFLPPASSYTAGQTGIGINVQVDPTPPGNVMNFGLVIFGRYRAYHLGYPGEQLQWRLLWRLCYCSGYGRNIFLLGTDHGRCRGVGLGRGIGELK
jgi:hypothetical protein